MYFIICFKAKASEGVSSDSLLSVPGQKHVDSSPETSPSVSPMSHSSSIANLQTASKLILSSRLVYSQPLDLPVGVELIRATPSAGKMLKLDTCSSEQSSVHKMDELF